MVIDPLADFLVRLQNASRVRKKSVTVPNSNLKKAVAHVLRKEGYIAEVDMTKRALSLTLLYRNGRPAIEGFRRMSKPGRRMYLGVRDIRPVKRGYGLVVLSTPAGVMSGREARRKRVGGEVLFEIW